MSLDWDSDLDRRCGPELLLGTTIGFELTTLGIELGLGIRLGTALW
jgi:hypothetical protein